VTEAVAPYRTFCVLDLTRKIHSAVWETGSPHKIESVPLKDPLPYPNLYLGRIGIYCPVNAGGDMASTWIAKPKVHAEVQFPS
jgi:hypothetical protein